MMTKQQIGSINVAGNGIPSYMFDSVLGYFNDHKEPGKFLCVLLKNDFMGAFLLADEKNLAALPAWAEMLYEFAPVVSYGSPEMVKEWLEVEL